MDDRLTDTIEDPAAGRRDLPALLGRLDGDDPDERIGAAWALCHVAAAYPDTVDYLADRLADRLDPVDRSPAVEAALQYIAAAYPDRVDLARDGGADARRRQAGDPTRHVHTRAVDGASGPARVRTTGDSERTPQSAAEEDDADADDGDDVPTGVRTGPRRVDPPVPPSDLETHSRFDSLAQVGPGRGGRYATVVPAIGIRDGRETNLSLALFDPPDGVDGDAHADCIERAGRDWAAVDDDAGVVTVHDHGRRPVPWLALEHTDATLADAGRRSLPGALAVATALARSLTYVHQRGVVHGGIDLHNVAVRGSPATGAPRPLFTNVALVPALRECGSDGAIDPRYAAPERLADDRGPVDAATDVYQLGAVVYTLVTG